mgnify:CR=1 FL=1
MMAPIASRPEPTSLRRQRGLSLFGLLFFGVIALGIVVIVMRVAPSAMEYLAAKRALDKIAASNETSPMEIQKAFDRIAAVEDIASIAGKDLKIVKNGNAATISFAYEKKIPLFANASLLLEYESSVQTK